MIVTAQSREQELQDVPIALQVIDAQVIEDVAAEDLGDLDSFVPGLVVNSQQPTQPSFELRGISTDDFGIGTDPARSEEHTSELQSLMRISYAVFCLKKKKKK